MPDGLLSRTAQGIDITTPLLQGIGLARQRQQDVQAQQQQQFQNQILQQQIVQKQKETVLKNLSDQQNVLIKMGDVDSAIRLMPEVFRISGFGGIDADALIEANRTKRLDFSKTLSGLSNVLHKDKTATQEQKNIAIQTALGKIKEAGTPTAPPTEVQPAVTGQAGVPDLAQQASPQDRIRAARQQLLNIQQQFPQLSQTAQGKAAIKTLEDSIKFEESQLTSVRGTVTNVDKMFDINVANWKAQNPGAILTPAITKTLRGQAHQTVGGTTNIIGTDPKTGNLLFMDTKTGDVIDAGRPRPAPGKLQPLSSQAAENVGVQNSVIQGIDRALENVRKKPELLEKIGPLEGRWTNIKRVFAADPEAEGLKREIESMIRVAYAWSGKQISIQELDRLRDAILPSLTNPDANFMVSLRHAKNIMETDRNAKLQAFKDANFDIGKLDRFLKKDKSAKTPEQEAAEFLGE